MSNRYQPTIEETHARTGCSRRNNELSGGE